MNRTATDSLKALANRTGRSVSELRYIAETSGFFVRYDSARKTYIVDEPAAKVVAFNRSI